jgi:eukaryotic-like serine/threonine-protein kinase
MNRLLQGVLSLRETAPPPAGIRLGPYEILAPLGAGGMREVSRAKDSKLGRQVAVKVLPEKFFEEKESI